MIIMSYLHLLIHLPLELILYTLELLTYEEVCYLLHYSPYLTNKKLNGYIVPLCISRSYFNSMLPNYDIIYTKSFELTRKKFAPSKSIIDYTYNMDLYYYITVILPQEMYDNLDINELQVLTFFNSSENLYTIENKLNWMIRMIKSNDPDKVLCVLNHLDSLESNIIETMSTLYNTTEILEIITNYPIIIETICSVGNVEIINILIQHLKKDCIDIEEDLATIPYIVFLHNIYKEATRINQTTLLESVRIEYN